MLGAVVAGLAKVGAVAVVAVAANEVWQQVKPKIVERGLSLFLEDNEDEPGTLRRDAWAEAVAEETKKAFPGLFNRPPAEKGAE